MKQYIVVIVVAIMLYLVLYRQPEEPTQRDIQDLSYVTNPPLPGKVLKRFASLDYPQISHGFTKLTKGDIKPLKDVVMDKVPASIQRVRQDTEENITPKRMYLPDYYRRDTMDPNDLGSSEVRPFERDEDESDSAWTDKNVSEHPKFYNSNVKDDGVTNIGDFFDKNNQYHDTTSSNTYALPSDNCYKDKQGKKFCMDYSTRLQMIPPELITGNSGKVRLNINRVMNGGNFMRGVSGSNKLGYNEQYSHPIPSQIGSCSV